MIKIVSQRCLFIYRNRTYRFITLRWKKGKYYPPRKISADSIEFSPVDIIEEAKPSWIFWRTPRRLLIFLEGNKRAMSFKDPGTVDMGFLTLADIISAIKTAIVQAFQQVKPLAKNQFYILLALGIINLVVMILGFRGAFV